MQAAAETVYAGDSVRLATREQAARDLLEVAFAGEDWADQVVFTVSSSEAADLGLLLAQLSRAASRWSRARAATTAASGSPAR